jgi:hypothetical protein
MKVAILSESSADEAALRVLVGAILQREALPVAMPPIRVRGFHAVLSQIPSVSRHLLYQTDADALAVVVDSNSSPVYADPAPLDADLGKCRLHAVRQLMSEFLQGSRPPAGRRPLLVAVGVAVPAIEAWLLCGAASDVTESAWLPALGRPSLPYTKAALKQRTYGTDRPDLRHETEKAVEHARRVAGNLALLEERFPIGFGSLARDVRVWATG